MTNLGGRRIFASPGVPITLGILKSHVSCSISMVNFNVFTTTFSNKVRRGCVLSQNLESNLCAHRILCLEQIFYLCEVLFWAWFRHGHTHKIRGLF